LSSSGGTSGSVIVDALGDDVCFPVPVPVAAGAAVVPGVAVGALGSDCGGGGDGVIVIAFPASVIAGPRLRSLCHFFFFLCRSPG
jgi:hypothetical protein